MAFTRQHGRDPDEGFDAAVADLEVDGIDTGGAHRDQKVAGPGRRLGQIDDGDRLFVAADGGGFHGGDSLSRKTSVLQSALG